MNKKKQNEMCISKYLRELLHLIQQKPSTDLGIGWGIIVIFVLFDIRGPFY